MNNVFSLYSATIAGVLVEVKEEKTDNNGNPYCMFVVGQTNAFNPDTKMTHWIKAWGRSKVEQIQNIPNGHRIIVEANGEPYTTTYDGKTRTKLTLQATKIIYVSNSSGSVNKGTQQTSNTAHKQKPDGDDVPF
jgi:hypothetical protein